MSQSCITDQCKLQDLSTTQGISLLTGQTIDHMAIVEKLSCGAGKAIEGGTKVQCTDGTSVYSQPNSDVPTCVGKFEVVVLYCIVVYCTVVYCSVL